MSLLEENRAVIGEVDQKMAELFVKRFRAVEGIAAYKIEQGMQVLDRSREEALIKEKEALVPEELRPYFRMWYEGMLAASRQYQTDIIEMNHRQSQQENK